MKLFNAVKREAVAMWTGAKRGVVALVTACTLGTGLSLGVATNAHAAANVVDVTAVVADIAAATTPIGLIGSAVLLVFVGIKVFKWVRRAM